MCKLQVLAFSIIGNRVKFKSALECCLMDIGVYCCQIQQLTALIAFKPGGTSTYSQFPVVTLPDDEITTYCPPRNRDPPHQHFLLIPRRQWGVVTYSVTGHALQAVTVSRECSPDSHFRPLANSSNAHAVYQELACREGFLPDILSHKFPLNGSRFIYIVFLFIYTVNSERHLRGGLVQEGETAWKQLCGPCWNRPRNIGFTRRAL